MFKKTILSNLHEPVNGLTHLGGAFIALFGLTFLLVVGRNEPAKVVSIAIYGVSLVSMFSASAAYHLMEVRPQIHQILRKLDHSAIFLLIAGTYTPFCVIGFTGFWSWGLLSIIWSIAIIGILIKVFWIEAPRWLNAATYVFMGWLCIMAAPQMVHALTMPVLIWLIIGGIIYTLGAVIYATKIFNISPGKFGFHEIWHIFVLMGALAHFVSVTTLVVSRV